MAAYQNQNLAQRIAAENELRRMKAQEAASTRQSDIAANTAAQSQSMLDAMGNVIGATAKGAISPAAPRGRGGADPQNLSPIVAAVPQPTSSPLDATQETISPLAIDYANISQPQQSINYSTIGKPQTTPLVPAPTPTTTQPEQAAKPWVIPNSPVGGFVGGIPQQKTVINSWDYPGAKPDYNPQTGIYRIDNSVPPAIQQAYDRRVKEIEAAGGQVWTAADSDALIQSQIAAKNRPENLAYDLAMRNRQRADNGQAPIESPFDKQAIGTDTKDWLGIAKYRQEDQQFAANQEMEQRKGMLAGVSTAGVSDPTAARAAFDKNLSVEQVGKVLEVVAQGDPKKSAEAYKAMQKANAKAAEAEAKAKADEERNNLEANSQRQVLNARNRSRKRQLYMRNMLGPLV